MYHFDNRIVITLDAGGTNLVFGAMRGCEFIVDPVTIPSRADNLDLCLQSMVNGFKTIIDLLDEKPVAISFAFPGPADYPNGIVGGYLPNFPSFRDGVALGPFLQEKFGLPVFINNDGDLFAFGEAMAGALPEINKRVAELGSKKQYKNLLYFRHRFRYRFCDRRTSESWQQRLHRDILSPLARRPRCDDRRLCRYPCRGTRIQPHCRYERHDTHSERHL